MKEGIHPEYYQAKVVCNCGNEFVTGSTKEEIHVEICSKCHSFTQASRKLLKHVVRLTSSIVNTVSRRKIYWHCQWLQHPSGGCCGHFYLVIITITI